MAGLKGSRRGADLWGFFRSGGTAECKASLTVSRPTRYLRASSREDRPFTLASRRIPANRSIRDSISALQHRKPIRWIQHWSGPDSNRHNLPGESLGGPGSSRHSGLESNCHNQRVLNAACESASREFETLAAAAMRSRAEPDSASSCLRISRHWRTAAS